MLWYAALSNCITPICALSTFNVLYCGTLSRLRLSMLRYTPCNFFQHQMTEDGDAGSYLVGCLSFSLQRCSNRSSVVTSGIQVTSTSNLPGGAHKNASESKEGESHRVMAMLERLRRDDCLLHDDTIEDRNLQIIVKDVLLKNNSKGARAHT